MKKLILCLFAVLFITTCIAQTTFQAATDTVVNAGTETITQKTTGSYANAAVQAVVTKLSGTVAGYAILRGSIDGTNYVDISTDTLTLANVTTNTYIWNVTPSKYLHYRVSVTGSGTMSAILTAYFLGR